MKPTDSAAPEIAIERSVYQQTGRGRVAVPIDLRLGIAPRAYTPRVARVVTRATAVMRHKEAADLLAEIGTAVARKSTIRRVPRAMAARYEQPPAFVFSGHRRRRRNASQRFRAAKDARRSPAAPPTKLAPRAIKSA